MMIDAILGTFNLSPKEISVFKKLLELGSQPASQIASSLEIPRNTVRSILDNLAKEGLLLKSNRGNTQYYTVEKKENMIRSLKLRKMRLEDELANQINLLESYGEELTQRTQSKTRPKITFYEGLGGLEKVYEDTLTAKEGIKSWASFEGMHETMPEYFKTYYERRTKKGIPIKSIHPDSPLARERQKKDKAELRESKLVPSDKYHWRPEIQIYNNRVNIASWKEKLGIIIESEEIAEAMNAIFEMSWGTTRSKDLPKVQLG